MDRIKNIEIFVDTEKLVKGNPRVRQAVETTNKEQYIVLENESITVQSGHRFNDKAKIIVSKRRTLEAASAYKGQKLCVLNFASATNPGGGVEHGSSAQEEAICRCSSLYFSISEEKIKRNFHDRHKQMLKSGNLNPIYTDDCIYSPNVLVFKNDTIVPKLLPENQWYSVDVISCAAPNLRKNPSNRMNPGSGNTQIHIHDKALKDVHIKRMRRILNVAKREDVDVIILGAFGCGAFANPPRIVADAMSTVIEEFRHDFAVIEFAVYCSPRDMTNYEVFRRKFQSSK